MFTEPYMVRALLAAVSLGPVCGLLGVFVTARRLAFFSDTVAHSTLAGVALGLWVGMSEPTIPMLVISLSVALLLLWLKERTELLTDTILALLLSTSVALGVVVFSQLKGYRGEMERYLFGDILSVNRSDLVVAGAVALIISALLLAFFNALTLITAHEDLAHVSGIPVAWINLGFVLALTAVVTLTIRLVGIILVTSLLVVPAATARNLARNLRQQVIFSWLTGFTSALGGVAASYVFNFPCGPSIVLVCAAHFLGSLMYKASQERFFRCKTP